MPPDSGSREDVMARDSGARPQTAEIEEIEAQRTFEKLVKASRALTKDPLSRSTRKLQNLFFSAAAIFGLAYFNLADIQGLPALGRSIQVSTAVVGWTAAILAIYWFIRFLSNADLELKVARVAQERIARSYAETRREIARFAEQKTAKTIKMIQSRTAKMVGQTEAHEKFGRTWDETEDRFRQGLRELENRRDALRSELAALPEDRNTARRRLEKRIEKLELAFEELNDKHVESMRVRLEKRPQVAETFSEDLMSENEALAAQFEAALAEVSRRLTVYGASLTQAVRREKVIMLLDVALPCIIVAFIAIASTIRIVCFLIPFVLTPIKQLLSGMG